MIAYFIDGDAGVTFAVSKPDEPSLVAAVFRKLRCDHGPLARVPRSLSELSDAIADAFGGECGLEVDV